MSFLCTVINREVDYDSCKNECQYIYKSPCIDKINEGYNQALEDFKKNLINEFGCCMSAITIGWLYADNVPHIDLEEHDSEIRRQTIDEVERAMYHECFEESHEQDGMQKWDSGNWIRYKLFEKVMKQMKGEEYGCK